MLPKNHQDLEGLLNLLNSPPPHLFIHTIILQTDIVDWFVYHLV